MEEKTKHELEHEEIIEKIYGDVSLDADIEEMEEDILLRDSE